MQIEKTQKIDTIYKWTLHSKEASAILNALNHYNKVYSADLAETVARLRDELKETLGEDYVIFLSD